MKSQPPPHHRLDEALRCHFAVWFKTRVLFYAIQRGIFARAFVFVNEGHFTFRPGFGQGQFQRTVAFEPQRLSGGVKREFICLR
jgi:hypothetical protein